MRGFLRALTSLLALSAMLTPAFSGADDPTTLGYNRDVRPILSENCFPCHGPDSAARKADLRLDKREAATADLGGYAVIVPKDPDASELIARIESADEAEMMPPPQAHKTLTEAQKQTLRKWIQEGAEYEPHWSFLSPKKSEPPAIVDDSRVRNPIDRFILARLEAEKLSLAPEADKRTLARRLSLDLTGLPPEPAVVEAFLADDSTDAYEKLVDMLLHSPEWGEHRARTWLDAARYADTHGYHFDNYREMWTYRDWVIGAFNRNLPFNDFVIQQLAGDLLPNATLDQQIASGFNRCNMSTNEGGTILEENLVLYTRDRTETTSAVFLGLTANCAVCHDHKYDPITQRDFYKLAAFFNNTTVGALDGNIKDTPPIRFVPIAEDRPRYEPLQAELISARQAVQARKDSARAEFDSWLAELKPDVIAAMVPAEALKFHAVLSPKDDKAGALLPAGQAGPVMQLADAGDYEKDQPFTVAAWVRPIAGKANGAIIARMDDRTDFRGWDLILQSNRVATHIIHKWPEDALKVVTTSELPENVWTHVTMTYSGSGVPDGVAFYFDGVKQPVKTETNSLKSTIRTTVPLTVGQRTARDRVETAAVNDLRLYSRALGSDETDRLAGSTRATTLIALPTDQRKGTDLDSLYAWWIRSIDLAARESNARVSALESEENLMRARGSIAHVMEEKGDAAMAFVLFRGEYDKRRDQVSADTPEALPPLGDLPHNRLGLARWLVRDDHPLTARVAVNRFWQEIFGTGLVRTSGDFGVAGETPSHPELLDWLAVSFRESGWDVKGLFRLMVNSAAYRQAATASPEKLARDPENRLLSRGPRFRLDAEVIRDYALFTSGLMVERLGGPSVRPYQPEGVWEAVAMPESDTKFYKPDSGQALYRRSLYTFWKRAAPPASMDILNAPSREVCTVRRERTNTPLQALVTLNDPQFIEAARALANRTIQTAGSDPSARIQFLGNRLLARPLSSEEASVVQGSVDQLLAYYREHPDDAAKLLAVGEFRADASIDPAELAAWTMLANEMLNLDEVLTK
jgi:Protein of unknown function (DUF1553)/Protein of unknown function (DUF1549)/Concanavalin A-like lectin/glucanases superfamily/Planctomycete cytochrome C